MGIYGTSLNDSTKVKLINKGSITFVSPFFANAMLCAVKFQSTMFKIGQKVVCIKVNPARDLVEGEIYTITAKNPIGGVKVKEAVSTNQNANGYFHEWRFRAIDDTWVDELLCKLMLEIEVEEWVSA